MKKFIGSALFIAILLLLSHQPVYAGVVSCGCYCGKTTDPPCSDEKCKQVCGWQEPSSGGSFPSPSYDDSAERQRQLEAERQRQQELEEQRKREEEARKKQEQFEKDKQEALKEMKGTPGSDLGLKGAGTSGELGLKEIGSTKATKERKVTAYTIQLDTAQGEFCIKNSDGSRLTNANLQAGHVARVETGTRVTTGPAGRLRIILPDETVFTIGPNSDMVMDEFVYDTNNNPKKITARLKKGIFRWVTGKTARKDPASMKVTLPVGDLGIRGTDFETFVKPDGSGYVKLFSGTLEITPKKSGAMFVMKEKNMVKFKPDGTFSKPEPIK